MQKFDRFKAHFETNEIAIMSPNAKPQIIKIEPRMMQVLKILLEHSPHLVTREVLIEQVWNNYGGADDALNQAISHLRKVLHDTDKDNRIIETVVKQGYRIKQQVCQDGIMTLPLSHQTIAWWKLLVFGLFLALAITGYYAWFNAPAPVAPKAPNADQSSPVPAPVPD